MAASPDVREAGRRVEQLLDSLVSAGEPQLRMHAEQLVGLLVELYGEGLRRIMSVVASRHPDDIDALISDELIAGLLVLHGLHPVDVRSRVRAAIDDFLVAQGSQAPIVDLTEVDDAGVVHLRWTAAASGCGSGGCGSPVTDGLHRLEATILDAVADVTAVEVEEVAAPKAPTLIPVESLFRDRPAMVAR